MERRIITKTKTKGELRRGRGIPEEKEGEEKGEDRAIIYLQVRYQASLNGIRIVEDPDARLHGPISYNNKPVCSRNA